MGKERPFRRFFREPFLKPARIPPKNTTARKIFQADTSPPFTFHPSPFQLRSSKKGVDLSDQAG
jgi:hypothetical protein